MLDLLMKDTLWHLFRLIVRLFYELIILIIYWSNKVLSVELMSGGVICVLWEWREWKIIENVETTSGKWGDYEWDCSSRLYPHQTRLVAMPQRSQGSVPPPPPQYFSCKGLVLSMCWTPSDYTLSVFQCTFNLSINIFQFFLLNNTRRHQYPEMLYFYPRMH